jgi:hypothetical protein
MGIGVRYPGQAVPDVAATIDILEIGPLLSGWHEPAFAFFDPEDHCCLQV